MQQYNNSVTELFDKKSPMLNKTFVWYSADRHDNFNETNGKLTFENHKILILAYDKNKWKLETGHVGAYMFINI